MVQCCIKKISPESSQLLQEFQSVTSSFRICHNSENLAGLLTSHKVIDSSTRAHAESVKQNQYSRGKQERCVKSRADFSTLFP